MSAGFGFLHPEGLRGETDSGWAVDPEPTNLITLWPRRDQPMIGEVRSLLSKALQEPVKILAQPEAEQSDPSVKWMAVLVAKSLSTPLIIWVEPMRPLPQETLEFLGAQKLKWAIGVETVLDHDDPHTHFVALLRMLGGAFHQSPGILNVNIGNWFLRQELEEKIMSADLEPTADILWVIHALRPNEHPEPGDKVWLFTEGLWRAGLPELEMLEVPFEHSGTAFDLLGGIAHLLMGERVPEPGEPLEVGPGLEVTFQPWREIAMSLGEDQDCGLNHRREFGYGTDRGVRAIVCGTEPVGGYKNLWTWPAEVVASIESGEAAIYRTSRWTARQEKLARRTWQQLREAFERLPHAHADEQVAEAPVFHIKAGFIRHDAPLDDSATDREHLWFQAVRFDQDRVEARLLNQPRSIAAIRKGDVRWLDRDVISDWQVATKLGTFGPGRADDMRLAVEAVIQEQPAP